MNETMAYTDKQLFEQIAEGNESAFRTLFQKYTQQLRPFILRISRSEEVVDEVIQETMIKVWLKRDTLVAVEDPKAWLCRVAANGVYAYFRREMLRQKLQRGLAGQTTENSIEPQDTVDLKKLQEKIQQGIELLPSQRRTVYVLRRKEGLTIPEIAAQLNLSPNTVRNTLASASEFIREYLSEQGYSTTALLLVLSLI